MNGGLDAFAEVMRRHVGRHTDGDPRRAIYQQRWITGGDNDGLFIDSVVSWTHIDRLITQFIHQVFGESRNLGFGIS